MYNFGTKEFRNCEWWRVRRTDKGGVVGVGVWNEKVILYKTVEGRGYRRLQGGRRKGGTREKERRKRGRQKTPLDQRDREKDCEKEKGTQRRQKVDEENERTRDQETVDTRGESEKKTDIDR